MFVHQMDIESRHSGWIFAALPDPNTTVMKVELKGPDHSLRLRQIKVLGNIDGDSMLVGKRQSPLVMQQKNCEAETLKVFRLLTSQVRLLTSQTFVIIILQKTSVGPKT